ncbi:hypothetical protein FRC09_010878 [Ceratobasidium sp. 395]|nr:hypothetical protein FRC09_010878 [Ceratobasidium sp. 395]
MSDSDQTPKDNAPSLLASLPGLSNVDPATSPPVEHCEEFVSSQASTPSSLDQPVLHHENYEPWSAANRNRSVAGPYPRPPVSRYEGREESLVTFIARFIGLSLRTLFSGPPPSRPFDTPEEGDRRRTIADNAIADSIEVQVSFRGV